MKYFILTVIISAFLFAQKTTPEDGWTSSGVAGLNLSQVSLSNWSQGGDNSLAFTVTGKFNFTYNAHPWKLENNLKLALGKTKVGDESIKTTDNEAFLENILTRDVGWDINPFFSNTVRTVIVDGFTYKTEPDSQIAAFFDPGYITQSAGFSYDQLKGFKTRLGIALQETFTNKFNNYADDPETNEIEDFKLETGIESVSEGEFVLDENLLLNSKLRLFTRFDALDVWDVRWDNTVTAKVNSYLNVNLNVLVIYEKIQSPKTQVKEALQLGITYTLF